MLRFLKKWRFWLTFVLKKIAKFFHRKFCENGRKLVKIITLAPAKLTIFFLLNSFRKKWEGKKVNEAKLLYLSRVARFFLTQYTKNVENIPTKLPLNYQMAIKHTKWPYTYIRNVHKIYQLFPFQGPPKFTQIVIFGMKIYYLATLYLYLPDYYFNISQKQNNYFYCWKQRQSLKNIPQIKKLRAEERLEYIKITVNLLNYTISLKYFLNLCTTTTKKEV
jgi:hypothetical protein